MPTSTTWPWRRPRFTFPAAGAPRTAVLRRDLRISRFCKAFDPNRPDFIRTLLDFRPQALAGSYSQLSDIARHPRPLLEGGSALVVFSTVEDEPLTDIHRDDLWNLFAVPVFEQILGADGELLASECEAHEGLHIPSLGLAAIGAGMLHTKCGCGRSTPRILAASELRGSSAERVPEPAVALPGPRTQSAA